MLSGGKDVYGTKFGMSSIIERRLILVSVAIADLCVALRLHSSLRNASSVEATERSGSWVGSYRIAGVEEDIVHPDGK